MKENELVVYTNIYEEAKRYMELEGVKILFGKNVFIKSLGFVANKIDMKTWNELDDIDFINVAYLQLLGRFPFEHDVEYWSSRSDFKKRLINTITDSFEFRYRNIEITNNPYPQNKWKQKLRNYLFATTPEELRKRWYFKIFTRLPGTLKELLRKTFGLN